MIAVGNDRLAFLAAASAAYENATSDAARLHIEREVERVRRDYEFFAAAERAA